MVKSSPAVLLVNVSVLNKIGQVLYLFAPQWKLPGTLLAEELSLAWTNRSLRFLKHQKAMNEGKEIGF